MKNKEIVAKTHSSLSRKVDNEVESYLEVEAAAIRYKEVKEYFESLKVPTPHVGVKVSEIDLSQNDRDINLYDEEFLALKDSISSQGLLQRPILTLGTEIRKPFLCVAGHRRIYALKELGRDTIPCELVFSKEEKDIRLARLSENLIRSDLKPVELADAVFRLRTDLGETTTGISKVLNKHRAYVTELIGIAKWPDEAKQFAATNNLNLTCLTKISRRKLTHQEIIKALEEVSNQKKRKVSYNTTPHHSTAQQRQSKSIERNRSKMVSYFEEHKINNEIQEGIILFLREMKIKGWDVNKATLESPSKAGASKDSS